MILELVQIILGLGFSLFIPGFLVVIIFFKEFNKAEKIAFSITFSIMISIAISIFFGYNEEWAAKTGGLTLSNIILAEFIVNSLLIVILLIQTFVQRKAVNNKKTDALPESNENLASPEKSKKSQSKTDNTEHKESRKSPPDIRKYIAPKRKVYKAIEIKK
ncbi:MAG: hypothetical protein KKF44_02430 [Nanoarchaeota archaeon]|nr:hypothetical protein [Nanoarchaeota archaeon]